MPKVKEISHYWNWSSMDPEKRARGALLALGANLQKFAKRVRELERMEGVSRDFNASLEIKRFSMRHKALHALYWEAVGRTANPMITGRANFPAERNQRANEATARRLEEIERHLKRGIRRAELRAFPYGMPGSQVRNEDPEAVQKLEAELEKLKSLQAKMKEANRLYRKGDDEALVEMGFSPERVKEWRESKDYFKAGPPFKDFDLTSIRGKIKRVEVRLELLRRRAERVKEGEVEPVEMAPGIHVVENLELDRLQVFFDDKPSVEAREVLKRHGFRWAPSKGAWQRKLTDNARRAIQEALKELA